MDNIKEEKRNGNWKSIRVNETLEARGHVDNCVFPGGGGG